MIDEDIYGRETFGEKIVDARLALHRGSFFGLPGAIAFMLAAAAMPLICFIWGGGPRQLGWDRRARGHRGAKVC